MASSACSRSRSRFACKPRVLLLDEPAAGVPEAERHDILAAVAALPRDVTVLLIEHDMDLVFPSPTGSRCWSTARCSPKARRRRSRAIRASGRSISARAIMAELLALEQSARRLRRGGRAARASRSRCAEGEALALLGRNGIGKTTLINTIVGVTRYRGGAIALGGEDITRLRADQRARPASAGCRRSATSSARSPSRRT